MCLGWAWESAGWSGLERGVQESGTLPSSTPNAQSREWGVCTIFPTDFPLAGGRSGTRKKLSRESRTRGPCPSGFVHVCAFSGA